MARYLSIKPVFIFLFTIGFPFNVYSGGKFDQGICLKDASCKVEGGPNAQSSLSSSSKSGHSLSSIDKSANVTATHSAAPVSGKVDSHQYHSDVTTHALISSCLNQGYAYCPADSWRSSGKPYINVSSQVLKTIVYKELKQMAEQWAHIIAKRAIVRAKDKTRWSGDPSYSRIVAEVLLDKDVRRGPVPSREEREARVQLIEECLSHPEGLRMAILMLPIRDRNPAKNDGPLPDLGEVDTLLRIWTIARAVEVSQDYNAQHVVPVRLFAVRDSKRYPSYWTDPESDLEAYSRGLEEMADALEIRDLVELSSYEQLEARHDAKTVALFHARRDALYSEKLSILLEPFEMEKTALLNLEGRTDFLNNVRAINGKMAELFEAVLHGRWHPELVDRSSEFRLDFLSKIYMAREEEGLEELRRTVLWNSLVGAAQYIAAYEANTGPKNWLNLDDIEFFLSGSLRLSFHKKPESSRQFTVEVGPSIHRTPWHGTASLNDSSGKNGATLEIRLSLELKNEGYIPVFVTSDTDDGTMLSRMAKIKQPISWVSPSLLALVEEEGKSTDGSILTTLILRKLRHL